jgi:hypothetical protein
MSGMKKSRLFLYAAIALVLFVSAGGAQDGQNAQKNFKLAEAFVKLLSGGEYYVKYQTRPNDILKPQIQAVKDGMAATLSEGNPDARNLSRDGNLYAVNDKTIQADVRAGKGQPPALPGGEYKFIAAGEEKYIDETLPYEEATTPDEKTVRFFFKESKSMLVFKSMSLCGVMIGRDDGGFGYLFPVVLETGKTYRKGMFDIPESYALSDPQADIEAAKKLFSPDATSEDMKNALQVPLPGEKQ